MLTSNKTRRERAESERPALWITAPDETPGLASAEVEDAEAGRVDAGVWGAVSVGGGPRGQVVRDRGDGVDLGLGADVLFNLLKRRRAGRDFATAGLFAVDVDLEEHLTGTVAGAVIGKRRCGPAEDDLDLAWMLGPSVVGDRIGDGFSVVSAAEPPLGLAA